MDKRERDSLICELREIKEVLDEAFPLESGVVKDQILSLLASMAFQQKLMKPPEFMKPLETSIGGISFGDFKRLLQENAVVELTKLAAEKGEEWVQATYERFKRIIQGI